MISGIECSCVIGPHKQTLNNWMLLVYPSSKIFLVSLIFKDNFYFVMTYLTFYSYNLLNVSVLLRKVGYFLDIFR